MAVEKINKIQTIPFLDTIYAFIMISFMIIPAIFCGFGNLLVPPMVGAKDMAFPTLNRLGFWIYVFAFFIMIMILTDFYQEDISFLLSLSLHSVAVSSVLCATNFVVTVLVMRNPHRSFKVFSPFIWSILVTSFLVLLYMPVMAVSGTMALLGRLSFFDEEHHGYFLTSLLIIILSASFVISAWLIMLIGKKNLLPPLCCGFGDLSMFLLPVCFFWLRDSFKNNFSAFLDYVSCCSFCSYGTFF